MSFWGASLTAGRVVPFVPPPDVGTGRLHVSQATLSGDIPDGTKAVLKCKVHDGEWLRLCSLREGGCEACGLDIITDEYTEFLVEGAAGVGMHLTGYMMPEFPAAQQGLEVGEEEEEGSSDEEMEVPPELQDMLEHGSPKQQLQAVQVLRMLQGLNDDGDDSEASDEEEEDDFVHGRPLFAQGLDSQEYESDDSGSSESDEELQQRSSVIIEEIHEAAAVDTPGGAGAMEADAMIIVTQPEDAAAPEDAPAKRQPAEQDAAAAGRGDSMTGADAELLRAAERLAAQNQMAQQADAGAKPRPKGAAKAPKAQPQDYKAASAQPQPQTNGTTKKRKAAAAAAAAPSGAAKAAAAAEATAAAGEAAPQLSKKQRKAQAKRQKTAAAAAAGQPAGGAAAAGAAAAAQPAAAQGKAAGGKTIKYENGFAIENLNVGPADAKLAKPGKKVVVRYRGTLPNGKVFDETKGNKTFAFRLGVGEVIKGWDRGVAGMRVGDKRKLTVPSQMAYGSAGVKGTIPPNATLNFTVELVDVK